MSYSNGKKDPKTNVPKYKAGRTPEKDKLTWALLRGLLELGLPIFWKCICAYLLPTDCNNATIIVSPGITVIANINCHWPHQSLVTWLPPFEGTLPAELNHALCSSCPAICVSCHTIVHWSIACWFCNILLDAKITTQLFYIYQSHSQFHFLQSFL